MTDISVACATHSMSGYYEKYFPGMRVFGHEDNVDKVDLLILTGGSDIEPRRYGNEPNGASGWDSERDEREMNIIRQVLRKNPDARILGVCRGLQMLNVYLGGDLIQDLDTEGKGHSGVHKLDFDLVDHPLSWLTTVNSLHHQAIRRFGYSDYPPQVIATEPSTGVIEIVAWEDQFLGVQFHPELFSHEPGSKFFSLITEWVLGNVSMFDSSEIQEEDEESEEGEESTEDWDEESRPVAQTIHFEPVNSAGINTGRITWDTTTTAFRDSTATVSASTDEMRVRLNELLESIRQSREENNGQ